MIFGPSRAQALSKRLGEQSPKIWIDFTLSAGDVTTSCIPISGKHF